MSSRDVPRLGLISHEFRKIDHRETTDRRLRNQHRISLLIQGEGDGNTGPKKLISERPMVWFTPADTPETLTLRGQIDLWTFSFEWPIFQIVSINEDDIELACFNRTRRTSRVKLADATDSSRMVEHFKLLQRLSTGLWNLSGALEVLSYIHILIAFYIDLPDVPSTTGVHRSLEQFHALLDERAFEPVSIRELADQVNMSAEYLRHLFYRRFGLQPHTYRAALRMTKARQLLSERRLSVKEVAHLVGYEDSLYFSRVFKKRYGITPSELMNQSRLRTDDTHS